MIQLSELRTKNMDELKRFRVLLDDVIREKELDIAFEVKNNIRVGSLVKINHNKTGNESFRVVDIKRKKAIVQSTYNSKQYSVPLELIRITENEKTQ